MGLNTTVVILNDTLNDIENDREFGKNLAIAIQQGDKYVQAGRYGRAAQVVETHHADIKVVVVVGGNTGELLHGGYANYRNSAEETAVQVLKDLGYVVYKRNKI